MSKAEGLLEKIICHQRNTARRMQSCTGIGKDCYPSECCTIKGAEFAISSDREVVLVDSDSNVYLGPFRVEKGSGKKMPDWLREQPGSYFLAQESNRVVQITQGYTRAVRWLTMEQYLLEFSMVKPGLSYIR